MEKELIHIINQLCEIEKKTTATDNESIKRHIDRIKSHFSEMGYTYHIPIGEPIDETRTDCVANILGESTSNLIITKVIKPIISKQELNQLTIIQKGNVIAESN